MLLFPGLWYKLPATISSQTQLWWDVYGFPINAVWWATWVQNHVVPAQSLANTCFEDVRLYDPSMCHCYDGVALSMYVAEKSETRIILCMHWANERRRCILMPSLIGPAHTENNHWWWEFLYYSDDIFCIERESIFSETYLLYLL